MVVELKYGQLGRIAVPEKPSDSVEMIAERYAFGVIEKANTAGFINKPETVKNIAGVMKSLIKAVSHNMAVYGDVDGLAVFLPFGTKNSDEINSFIEKKLVDPHGKVIVDNSSTNPVCQGITIRRTYIPGLYLETLTMTPSQDADTFAVKRIVGRRFVPKNK